LELKGRHIGACPGAAAAGRPPAGTWYLHGRPAAHCPVR